MASGFMFSSRPMFDPHNHYINQPNERKKMIKFIKVSSWAYVAMQDDKPVSVIAISMTTIPDPDESVYEINYNTNQNMISTVKMVDRQKGIESAKRAIRQHFSK